MRKPGRNWKALRREIQALVDAGLTDEQIGRAFGVSSTHMCSVRARLGIAARRKRGRQPGEPPPPPPELPSYTDKDGRTVKVCPPRYAEGCDVQGVTVRARGRRGKRGE